MRAALEVLDWKDNLVAGIASGIKDHIGIKEGANDVTSSGDVIGKRVNHAGPLDFIFLLLVQVLVRGNGRMSRCSS
jgi:hypothetical protein